MAASTPNDRSPHGGGSRYRALLVRLDRVAETGAGFGETLLTTASSAPRRERLAQAARGTEVERPAQKIRRRRSRGWQRPIPRSPSTARRRVVMEYPDRCEAAHMRHEYINDHQVEGGHHSVRQAACPATRDRDPEAALLEPQANGNAVIRVVIDHQDSAWTLPHGVERPVHRLRRSFQGTAVV